jgi:hypothetical protein
LDVCSRRSLTRFASLMISRHSEALWRLLGCTGHVPLLPPCGRGRLLRSLRPLVAAATIGATDCGFSWPRFFFFFFFLPSWMTAPEPPVWATPVYGTECHTRPSAALAHLSARAKSVVTVSTSCVANFSSIFSSCTPVVLLRQMWPELGWPSRRAEMIRQCGAAHAGQRDTRLDPGAHWSLRCNRNEVVVEVATLDVLSALTRPL